MGIVENRGVSKINACVFSPYFLFSICFYIMQQKYDSNAETGGMRSHPHHALDLEILYINIRFFIIKFFLHTKTDL